MTMKATIQLGNDGWDILIYDSETGTTLHEFQPDQIMVETLDDRKLLSMQQIMEACATIKVASKVL